jgi:hypothetical protein
MCVLEVCAHVLDFHVSRLLSHTHSAGRACIAGS